MLAAGKPPLAAACTAHAHSSPNLRAAASLLLFRSADCPQYLRLCVSPRPTRALLHRLFGLAWPNGLRPLAEFEFGGAGVESNTRGAVNSGDRQCSALADGSNHCRPLAGGEVLVDIGGAQCTTPAPSLATTGTRWLRSRAISTVPH
ncbi:hypothetical protein B0H11DRAFT_2231914 [Mycena galericulata]|nr:hypothetical protein B0H11DRAFT_2231914 [Mycena galericulata]